MIIKRKIEDFFIFPFIMLGRFISLLNPHEKEYKIYFFFPFYHIGGAEKVHYQVASAVGGIDCIIYFTKKSHGNSFLKYFIESGCIIYDISRYTDNKWLYFLNFVWRGILSGYINRQKMTPVVFNGQCNFGYKISPWIKKETPQIELIHAVNTFSYIRLPFLNFYKRKITVSDEIINKHKILYQHTNIPRSEFDNFIPIMSKIKLDEKPKSKNYNSEKLIVLYVGRSTFEKRHLLAALVAKNIIQPGININFEFAGISKNEIPPELQEFCTVYGDIGNENELKELYKKAHILIIPSSSESGPLVFMEAMAQGLAIISTPVGYIPTHIKDGVSGFVTNNLENEGGVSDEMVSHILKLYKDRSLLQKIGEHNIDYAYNNFDIKYFNLEYKFLFTHINQST